jgi:Lon protease-like protein
VGAAAFDPRGFSGIVPVFPLPGVVLFPGMFLPLHIFEPRYRAMTADALRGERLIAMALLRPGWEPEYQGSPAIHPVVGVGKILEDARLEDGRYNLVLLGLSRARVIEEVGTGPYRLARVELLAEREPATKDYERKRRVLLSLYVALMKDMMGAVPTPPDDIPLGMLCDLVSSLLTLDSAAKQGLLEELDVAARCDRLMRMLEEAPPPKPGADEPTRRKRPWPMGPSLN